MKTALLHLLTAAALLAPFSVRADEKPKPESKKEAGKVYDPKDLEVLRTKKDEQLTLEGTIVRSGVNKAGTHRYLNFAQDYWTSAALVFFVSKNPTEFTKEKLDEWVGKKVRASGKLTEYGSSMQIEIESWDQLKEVK